MASLRDLEALVTQNLAMRGPTHVPGPQLAFSWQGQPVMASIDPIPYTDFFLTVHDRGKPLWQFRARAGEYDWNQVGAIIAEIELFTAVSHALPAGKR